MTEEMLNYTTLYVMSKLEKTLSITWIGVHLDITEAFFIISILSIYFNLNILGKLYIIQT